MCKVPTTRDHRDLVQISGKMSHADDLMQHFSNNEQVIRYNFVHWLCKRHCGFRIFTNKKVSNYSDFLKSNFLRFCTHTRVALTSMVKHTDINTRRKIVKATR